MARRPASPHARTTAAPSSVRAGVRAGVRSGSRDGARRASGPPTNRSGTGPPVLGPSRAASTGRLDDAGDALPPGSRPVSLARLVSVRALVLGVVVLVAFSMLFPTLRSYLGQRAELDALQQAVGVAEQREEHLRSELDRWGTDEYVAAQARERLGFVLPGETAYRVIDPEVVVEVPAVEGGGEVVGAALPVGGALAPWYTTVWESVRLAGESAVATTSEPSGAPAQPGDASQPAVEPSPGPSDAPAEEPAP